MTAFSPTLILATPRSHPLITWPAPKVNTKGLFLSTEESNLVPLVRVPV